MKALDDGKGHAIVMIMYQLYVINMVAKPPHNIRRTCSALQHDHETIMNIYDVTWPDRMVEHQVIISSKQLWCL